MATNAMSSANSVKLENINSLMRAASHIYLDLGLARFFHHQLTADNGNDIHRAAFRNGLAG